MVGEVFFVIVTYHRTMAIMIIRIVKRELGPCRHSLHLIPIGMLQFTFTLHSTQSFPHLLVHI